MATFESLEEIDVWQDAREFADKIYSVTSQSPFFDDYSLKDQIRRAGNSIALNIAEGYGLGSEKEFIRHLTIARGSTKEVRSALYLAFDQDYLEQEVLQELLEDGESLSKRITALIQYLKDS